MEIFLRVALIALFVLGLAQIIFALITGEGNALNVIIGVVGLLLGVAVIVISFKVNSPWYLIAMAFGSAACFAGTCVPGENQAVLIGCGIVAAVFNLISCLLVFIH